MPPIRPADVERHLREQGLLLVHVLRWILLGAVSGVLAGIASAALLGSLSWATRVRTGHPWLLFLLPLAGLLVGLAYHHAGGRSQEGNNLIIDEIHEPQAWVPRRLAPLVLGATVVTHVFGGSAGREGTAIQMAGSLTDHFARLARLEGGDRRVLLITAIAAGFGSVFGVPLAGCVFGLEVQAVGRMRYDALLPALAGSVVGDQVVRALGVHHLPVPAIAGVHLDVLLASKLVLAGVVFGAVALAFAELTHAIKRLAAARVAWPPLRPVIGGLSVIAMTYAVGSRDYLGLSLPLISRSLAGGAGVIGAAFLLKLVFTSVTLGSGFQGGEVTPLFVIGATLGATLGDALHAPVPLFAAMGFVAVFAGATKTPIACTVMAAELFGVAAVVPFAVACIVSYTMSSPRGIYRAQRLDTAPGRPT